jgi:hypothetical protein
MATDETSYVKAFDAQGQFLEQRSTQSARQAVIAAMRELARSQRLNGVTIKELIVEGRR